MAESGLEPETGAYETPKLPITLPRYVWKCRASNPSPIFSKLSIQVHLRRFNQEYCRYQIHPRY